MKDTRKKIICMLLVFTIVFTADISVQVPAQAKGEVDCKSLCVAALKATGGGKKLKGFSMYVMQKRYTACV